MANIKSIYGNPVVDDNLRQSVATEYSSSSTYAVGDMCLKDGVLYKCTTAISMAEAWTAAHWTAVTVGGELATVKDGLNNCATVTAEAKDFPFVISRLTEMGAVIYAREDNKRIISGAQPIYCLGGTISCGADYKFRVAYYSSSKVFVNAAPDNFIKFSDWITNDTYVVESGYWIIILAGRSDNSIITDAKAEIEHYNISLNVPVQYINAVNAFEIQSDPNMWGQGLYSAGSGNYEASNYRIYYKDFLPDYLEYIMTDSPYVFRLLAWDADGNFKGVCKTDKTFSTGTSNLLEFGYYDHKEFKKRFPSYKFKIYAFSNVTSGVTPCYPSEASHIYMFQNVIEKYIPKNGMLYGKTVAIIGDSISTNGNDGQDKNVAEITVTSDDVGVELSAYLTYYDVQAGLSLGGHTFTSDEIGTEVTFTPTQNDVGKSIGLPNNYNPNTTTVWWEIVQDAFGNNTIPVCWSGSSITSHEASTDTRKTAHAWHPAQIRKCGIRKAGTMQRTAPDVIIIYRGTNDFSHTPYTLLTDNYFDSYNWEYPTDDTVTGGYGFKEGLCLTVKKLREAYPLAQVWICTMNVFKRINYSHFPTNNGIDSLPQYNDAIREVADFLGCNVIEFDKDGITFENCYSGGYITDSSTIPTHPTDKGHYVMGQKAIADIKAKYNELI